MHEFIAEGICITLFGEISMKIQFSVVFTINPVLSIISKDYRMKIFTVIILFIMFFCVSVYVFIYCQNLGQPNST